jgi:hypothetical protein
VRIFFLLLLLIGGNSLFAQQRFPAGVANTYTLSDKDGYNGSGYFLMQATSAGVTYSVQYFNYFTIHGNNYSKVFDTLRKVPGGIYSIKIARDKGAWVIGSDYVAVFSDMRLIKIDKAPFTSDYANEIKDSSGVYYFVNEQGHIAIWFYDGHAFKKIAVSNQLSDLSVSTILNNVDGDTWLCKQTSTGADIFKLDFKTGQFNLKNKIQIGHKIVVASIRDENYFLFGTDQNKIVKAFLYNNGRFFSWNMNLNNGTENTVYSAGSIGLNPVLYKQDNLHNYIASIENNKVSRKLPFISNDFISGLTTLQGRNFIGNANNKPFRIFPYIKKYPGLYNHTYSNNVFAVKQDGKGRIWAGSYQGDLSIIDKDAVKQLPEKKFQYMNGGCFYNGNMYLIGEGKGGLIQINEHGIANQVTPATYTGFSTYVSKNKKYLYYGSAGNRGLWQTSTVSLEKKYPQWNKIDSTKGSAVSNILTITEDTLGRIWYGHPRRALAMYNPTTDKATTWLTEKNEGAFGAFAALTDPHGTVWIASGTKGLWHYSDYSKPAIPQSFNRIIHPFLQDNNLLTGLAVYKGWLVIAATDKMLLLNIDSLFYKQKTILRYLNPQEAAFTSTTEQNTLITSNTDSTVWFSTSDMLYQWDVKTWLNLTAYKVKVNAVVIAKDTQMLLQAAVPMNFEPGSNSFEIQCHYVSPDNLPRYISAMLLKNGEKVEMPSPGMESSFVFKNLESGNYTFLLDIFESDGSITHYSYPILLEKFLWQQWWFWILICIAIVAVFIYLYDLKKRKQLAEQRIKLKEAELAAFKSDQEKKLANLQLITLSSQFRPHFILNALNTIGAQMDDKPEAESVLSRLGESVNLIFNHAQQQKILHPFENEWTLVKNVIHIHTLMYLKALQVNLPDSSEIEKIKNIQVPLGILQIPVENALLHGLSNKETGPWNLTIAITENEQSILVTITDNGVGRKKSAKLSNFTKHGTGTKNQQDVLQIINAANTDKITIVYTDDMYVDELEVYGTSVLIKIPKHLNYGNK